MDWSYSSQITLKNGDVVSLRYPAYEDAAELREYINRIVAEDTRILLDHTVTLEEEQEYLSSFLASMEKDDAIKLFVVHDGMIVGAADIRRQLFKQKHVGMFGISISKDFRGMGLGREIMKVLLGQAKSVMDVEMVILSVNAENVAALSLYKSLGFVESGVTPKAFLQNGKYEDLVSMYKML